MENDKPKRPETTLFMLISVDGKISTGDNDILDADKDWKRIVGVKEGLQQYYDLEKETDYFSLNTGRVMAKIGVNERTEKHSKVDVNFIIIDNQPHLQESGLRYLSDWVNTLYLVTTNKEHPAYELAEELGNIVILEFEEKVDLKGLLETMKEKYGAQKVTIQSGGTMNASFIREGLVDHLSIVVAPLLVGGKDTPTLVDGESIHEVSELSKVKALKLKSCDVLENSYIHLQYDVLNDTQIVD